MAPEVAAAWVAGLFSVAAAVVTYLQARSASHAQQRIETLRSELEEQSSEKEARRQYEYEARDANALTPAEREALRTRGWIGSTAYEFVSAAFDARGAGRRSSDAVVFTRFRATTTGPGREGLAAAQSRSRSAVSAARIIAWAPSKSFASRSLSSAKRSCMARTVVMTAAA